MENIARFIEEGWIHDVADIGWGDARILMRDPLNLERQATSCGEVRHIVIQVFQCTRSKHQLL